MNAQFHDLRSWEIIGKLSGYSGPKQVQGRSVYQFTHNGRVVGVFDGHKGLMENVKVPVKADPEPALKSKIPPGAFSPVVPEVAKTAALPVLKPANTLVFHGK